MLGCPSLCSSNQIQSSAGICAGVRPLSGYERTVATLTLAGCFSARRAIPTHGVGRLKGVGLRPLQQAQTESPFT
ncbi:hypothetical protein CBM2629_B140034 [Cupriavidus taiwanensis]|nr:hypothetical protein CBM2629_B140034 [Cupriavidus taiwanensis]